MRDTKSPKSYAEALRLVGETRPKAMGIMGRLQPDLLIDETTQAKIITTSSLMMFIGRGPGDFPVEKFDMPIKFKLMQLPSLEWLEKCGLNPRRAFAPLASEHYAHLFGTKDKLPVSEQKINKFFGSLIHCLVVETQILVAKQYYHGTGLYEQNDPGLFSNNAFAENIHEQGFLYKLGSVEIGQLHGRIFLEYSAIMIRAQWDKLVQLQCLVFDVKVNSDKISKVIDAIRKTLQEKNDLHEWSKYHSLAFLEIAKQRISENGWLKKFRDPLIHNVGQHSSGVIPQNKSFDSTSQMWDKVCDEHNALREGMLCLLASIISKGIADKSMPDVLID